MVNINRAQSFGYVFDLFYHGGMPTFGMFQYNVVNVGTNGFDSATPPTVGTQSCFCVCMISIYLPLFSLHFLPQFADQSNQPE